MKVHFHKLILILEKYVYSQTSTFVPSKHIAKEIQMIRKFPEKKIIKKL